MKPAFALSFSATGISLHHQSDDDWFCIGNVALDAPDLNSHLHALREKAFALENNLRCKVIIPTEQVRFLSVETDNQPLEEDIKEKLAKATPYTVEDLVFDTATVGPTTYVAAVTQQTLDEAREFATEHGFIPVQFTTETDPESFPSEPLFGTSESAPFATEAKDEVQSDAAEPNVHPIAEEAAPDVFRSAPATSAPSKIPTEVFTKQYVVPAAAALGVAAMLGAWALIGSNEIQTAEPKTAQVEDALPASTPQASVETENPTTPGVPPAETAELDTDATLSEQDAPAQNEDVQPELSPTDTAILEALNIAPTIVEEVTRDPVIQATSTQPGLEIIAPDPLLPPVLPPQDELYLASVDNSNLSTDAVALPIAQSFATDEPFDQVALPSTAGAQFELDDRGLVTPSAEGTLNPDGIVVYLGRPSKTPPEPPVRFEEEPTLEKTSDRLAGLRPKPRPSDLIEQFERQQLGGRTREELAGRRPKLRPASLQQQPQIDYTPTALAVVRVPRPKSRPAGLAPPTGTQTANLGSTAAIGQVEAGSFQPKAVAPKIPSAASVARQATIDNALNLRKLNLIGVYGTPANRRALVRLPSGRYKKLKVGDRVDGGKVIAIGDSELRYQKKGRNLTLKMPRS
ncbi:hypothetical protein [Ruegeria arenilitoris]|uniref:hypothetical protein n=1 Tax=Ruegeria arenilitoris TaxID=1173585 RepID=UPI001CFE9E39|nr:hypothetical protein [Ruegeria arenilitoris]